jgi:hypothetical protein
MVVIAENPSRSFDAQGGCETHRVSILQNPKSVVQVAMTVANGTQIACFSTGSEMGLELHSLIFDIPVQPNFLGVVVTYSGPGFDSSRAIIDQILSTLVIK